ncbi:YbaB/EbfC family nucleoid-associated protein [Nocardia sp. X0981]
MPNEHMKAQFDDILDAFRRSMDEISVIERKRAELVATGHAEDKRVTISVDAQGRILQTCFAEDISDLSYDEIAAAVTTAARAAQEALAAASEEIMRPLREQQARLPKVTDLVAGLAGAGTYVPEAAGHRGAPEVTDPGTAAGDSGIRESLW